MNQPTAQVVKVVLPNSPERDQLVRRFDADRMLVGAYACLADCLQDLRSVREPAHFAIVCELHDSSMPGLSFQHELQRLAHASMIVFWVQFATVAEVVQAMRQGAVAVVERNDALVDLLKYVKEAADRSVTVFHREAQGRETLVRLGSLNTGEHEVLQGIMAGKLNKEIAQELNLSIRTIEQRRREVFRKMNVQHPALLARKVIEAAQGPRVQLAGSEDARWLVDLRHDDAHAHSAGSHSSDSAVAHDVIAAAESNGAR